MPITVRKKFKIQMSKPKMYFVYIINEKHISWDFCIRTLMNVFNKNRDQAEALAEEILTNGEAICGVYMYDIAETKATMVEQLAKDEDLSMSCLIEEV